MERWLHLLPDEQIQRSPILLCARIWIMQTHAQHTDLPQVLTTIENLLAQPNKQTSSEDDYEFRLLHALVEIGWGHWYYRTGQAQSSLEHARSAMAWLPAGEEQGQIFALMYLALSSQLAGEFDIALMELDKGLRSHAQHLVSTAHLLMRAGAGIPGCWQVAAGGANRTPFTADCQGWRSYLEPKLCPLVAGSRALRTERAG